MKSATITPHVRIDKDGRAWIDDTNVKVVEIVLDHLAYGWSAEEMHLQHSGLSLAQIYAALGYYYDHREEIDSQIEATGRKASVSAKAASDSPVRRRLRAAGKL